jgi:hypothetical protein
MDDLAIFSARFLQHPNEKRRIKGGGTEETKGPGKA